MPEARPPDMPPPAGMVVVLDGPALATAVKAQMVVLGIKHAELARAAGISESTLSEIKSGSNKQLFRAVTLEPLSAALKFPRDALVNIYRKLVPRANVLSDHSVLEEAVAAAVAPGLTVIRARLDRIETHLHLDPMHGPGDYVTPEISDSFHHDEDPGQ